MSNSQSWRENQPNHNSEDWQTRKSRLTPAAQQPSIAKWSGQETTFEASTSKRIRNAPKFYGVDNIEAKAINNHGHADKTEQIWSKKCDQFQL